MFTVPWMEEPKNRELRGSNEWNDEGYRRMNEWMEIIDILFKSEGNIKS